MTVNTVIDDPIYASFLARQLSEGLALSQASDLFELIPMDEDQPTKYLVRFRCKGLVKRGQAVDVADRFDVGIRFPSDYLRRVDPCDVLTWLGPREVFHPNISAVLPFICIGPIPPGTSLVDLVYQVFEVVSYQRVTMREDDALNGEACVWARSHRDRFPVDRRPLRRRTLSAMTVRNDNGGHL